MNVGKINYVDITKINYDFIDTCKSTLEKKYKTTSGEYSMGIYNLITPSNVSDKIIYMTSLRIKYGGQKIVRRK